MEKYFITDFKKIYADIILHNQKELNPNGNECIEGEEIDKVKNFFKKRYNIKDISELLANQDEDDETVGSDTVEISETTDGEPKDSATPAEPTEPASPDEPEETEESEESTSEEEEPSIQQQMQKMALDYRDSAMKELSTIVDADLSVSTPGEVFSEQIEALRRSSALQQNNVSSTMDADIKIGVMQEMAEEYKKDNSEVISQNTIIKEIKYGKDNSKKGILIQRFGLNTNSALKRKGDESDTEQTEPTEPTEQTEQTDQTDQAQQLTDNNETNQSQSNSTDVEVNYNVDFRTFNPDSQGNYIIHGTVNVGSDNSDVMASVLYTKTRENGAKVNFYGNIRETIESKNNIGSYGAAFDYSKNNFSTGLYGMYCHREVEGVKDKEAKAELYGKYARTLRFAVGYERDDDEKDCYVNIAARGRREFSQNGLTIAGKVEAGYNASFDDDFDAPLHEFKVKASGALSFKSDNLNADVFGNLLYARQKLNSSDVSLSAHSIGASVLAKLSTKDIDLSTSVSAISTPYKMTAYGETTDLGGKPSITTSVEIGIKNLFGKNVKPVLKYTVGNYEGAKHNIGVGVVVTP